MFYRKVSQKYHQSITGKSSSEHHNTKYKQGEQNIKKWTRIVHKWGKHRANVGQARRPCGASTLPQVGTTSVQTVPKPTKPSFCTSSPIQCGWCCKLVIRLCLVQLYFLPVYARNRLYLCLACVRIVYNPVYQNLSSHFHKGTSSIWYPSFSTKLSSSMVTTIILLIDRTESSFIRASVSSAVRLLVSSCV